MTDNQRDEDVPEGSIQRNVKMSETLFQQLGASSVDWGDPDEGGFYTPTLRTEWPGLPELKKALSRLVTACENYSPLYEDDPSTVDTFYGEVDAARAILVAMK